MFRDENIARHERELAELRTKLDAERERAERAEAIAKRVAEREAAEKAREEMDDAERKLRGGWFKQWLDSRAERRRERSPSFGHVWGSAGYSTFDRSKVIPAIALLLIIGVFSFNFYHYCTDIQEGVVTGRDYHPPHTSCTSDSHGHTSCTTYPESWSVDIAFQGQSATWSVSEGEYNRLRYGDWYCYSDLFHSEDNCHGRPR